jgi:hypothetical protein
MVTRICQNEKSMAPSVFIDLVIDSQTGEAVATAVIGPVSEAESLRQVPDPRFANGAGLDQMMEEAIHAQRIPEAWVAPFSPQRDHPVQRVIELLEWVMWVLTARGEAPSHVLATDRAGIRGASAAFQSWIRLPAREDLELAIARALDAARRVGLGTTGEETRTSALTYGVPGTPAGLVVARILGSLVLHSGLNATRKNREWVSPAPGAEVTRRLLMLADTSSESPARPMGVARIHTILARTEGLVEAIAAPIALRALDSVMDSLSGTAGSGRTKALLRATLGEISGIVEARQGDYEACERVLERLWDERDPNTPGIIEASFSDDPWALTRAHFLRAQVANHRGDYAKATRSLDRAREIAQQERSIRMRLLMAEAAVVSAGAAQNRWPFDPSSDEERGAMDQAADWLHSSLVDLEDSGREKTDAAAAWHSEQEEPTQRDPFLGAALGTFGRTLAFLGQHDDATTSLLRSRRCFSSASDLCANAVYLTHVELDRPSRTDPDCFEQFLSLALEPAHRTPDLCSQRLLHDDGFRFLLNVLLKALAFGLTPTGVDQELWAEALSSTGDESAFSSIARLRSHPSELLARHAGEVLSRWDRPAEAARWLDLSVKVGRSGEETMRRLAQFTERLANGDGADLRAPRGSVFNPCFEYR